MRVKDSSTGMTEVGTDATHDNDGNTMKATMIKCDNPRCNQIGYPENTKPYIPPYGWISLKGYIVGCGPKLTIEVCQDECLTPAVTEAIRLYNNGFPL